MKKENISLTDVLLNYLFYVNNLNKFTIIKTYLGYRRIYRNYVNVNIGEKLIGWNEYRIYMND
jgi:hypothetical protein